MKGKLKLAFLAFVVGMTVVLTSKAFFPDHALLAVTIAIVTGMIVIVGRGE